MNGPTLTIITPTYNSAEYLETCILSVAHQSYAQKEHLIIDNLSTDGTVEIVKKYALQYPHIQLITEQDKGIYDAMNKGIERSSGEWLYFLGSDDTLFDTDVLSDIFCSQACLQKKIIYGNVTWGANGPIYDGQFTPLKLLNKNICQQAIFFSKEIFDQLGLFDIRYRALADWVLNMRWFFKKDISVLYLDKTIAVYNPYGFSSNHLDQVFVEERKSLVHRYFPEEYVHIFDLENTISDLNNEADRLIISLSVKEQENNALLTNITNLNNYIRSLQSHIDTLDNSLNIIENSFTWRLTKPIRKLPSSFKKRSTEVRNLFDKTNNTKPKNIQIDDSDQSCNLVRLYNEFKLSDTRSLNPLNETIDIIIPVFNELVLLPPLCKSIVDNTLSPYRLFIIDDCSTEKDVYPFLNKFKLDHPQLTIEIIQNKKHIGFINSVNQVVQYTKNNFVILNCVHELPTGWLERLMHPILENKSIASTTPFTADDLIHRYFDLLDIKDNDINFSVNKLDRFFQNLIPINEIHNIYTGFGFCMGVNKLIFDEIGLFDNNSSRAEYGDEAEWCIKAAKKGYRNIFVPNLFVYHHKNRTLFDDIKQQPNSGLTTIQLQNEAVQNKFLNGYPLREISQFLILYMLSTDQCKCKRILFIDHDLGGGANVYRINYIKKELYAGNQIFLFTFNYHRKIFELRFLQNNLTLSFESNNLEQIKNVLTKYVGIDNIVLSETVSFPNISALLDIILSLQESHSATLSTLIHDFFCICPCYTLLDNTTTFCGPPDSVSTCLACLPQNNQDFRIFYKKPDIIFWRRKWNYVLNRSNEIICFSNSSKDILLKAYPNIEHDKILVIPHSPEHLSSCLLQQENVKNYTTETSTLTIGILGSIQIPKGASIIAKMLTIIEEENRNVQIIIIGDISPTLHSKHLKITGKYTHDRLQHIISNNNIDIFLIPAIWPETFSYTTEEIMQMGFPLAVFNLGAPAERAARYAKGFILSKIDPRTALDEISNYMITSLNLIKK